MNGIVSLAMAKANTERTIRLPAADDTPDSGLRPGDLVEGRFRLGSIVGWGGQAVVFQAHDLARNGSQVAIKAARRDLPAATRHEAADVLRWEGGLLRRLRHPALPRLYKLYSSPQSTWLARDMVPGASLLTLARSGPQDQRRVLLWATLLCDLLTYLHTQAVPVVCSDLKPANLVLRPDGTLALIDLGAAQTLTRRPPRKPRPRHGTPGYAPPEQLGNWGHDERSDVFSLAVTCYELLTGIDPTQAPLQFDLARLDRHAPLLAPALCWALDLDLARRCPTAAALRSRLGAPAPAPALTLGYGVSLRDLRDLNTLILRHPQLIEPAVANGALEVWLARHPDPSLGNLRYSLRATRRLAAPRDRALDLLLGAMAPIDGSPLLHASPKRLQLDDIPLKSWRAWSRPAVISLHNSTLSPQRWELEAAAQPDAEVRFLVDGRPQRKASGVLAPGAQLRVELVAMGTSGPRSGTIELRCGLYRDQIIWEGMARAGLPVGGQYVCRPEDLDLQRADLVPALEALLIQGTLVRWLRSSGQRPLAGELERAMKQRPDELERRLLVGRVLHILAPDQFPLLQLRGLDTAVARPIAPRQISHVLLEVANLAGASYAVAWRSQTPWARVLPSAGQLGPFEQLRVSVEFSPPQGLVGIQPVALDLMAGRLSLPVILPIQIAPESLWTKIRRLFGG